MNERCLPGCDPIDPCPVYRSSPDVSKMADFSVTIDLMKEMRGNTPFWISLWPKLDVEAFIHQARHYLSHCSPNRRNTTYDDAVAITVLPEALRRIEIYEERLREAERVLVNVRQDILMAHEHSHRVQITAQSVDTMIGRALERIRDRSK